MAMRMSAALPANAEQLRYEPVVQRIRVTAGGAPVADTTSAMLVWEPRRVVPMYALPWDDFRTPIAAGESVQPDLAGLPPMIGPQRFGAHTTPGRTVAVTVGERTVEQAGFAPDDADLGGRVILDFPAFEWREEDQAVIGHPHDPFKRIDVLPSSRHVQVAVGGEVLADSTSPMMLLETYLPPRWYLPAADVRLDLLTPSELDTVCAYKGHAAYYSYEPAGDAGRNIAWSYADPLHDALQVKGMICFFAERTDHTIDGVTAERPRTFWS